MTDDLLQKLMEEAEIPHTIQLPQKAGVGIIPLPPFITVQLGEGGRRVYTNYDN